MPAMNKHDTQPPVSTGTRPGRISGNLRAMVIASAGATCAACTWCLYLRTGLVFTLVVWACVLTTFWTFYTLDKLDD